MKKSHETGNSLQQNFHSGIGCLMRILLRYCMQFSRKFPTGTWCPKNFFPLYRDSNEFFASGIWYSLKNFAGNLVSQKYLTCIGRLWDEKFVCKVFLVLFFASYTILCRKVKRSDRKGATTWSRATKNPLRWHTTSWSHILPGTWGRDCGTPWDTNRKGQGRQGKLTNVSIERLAKLQRHTSTIQLPADPPDPRLLLRQEAAALSAGREGSTVLEPSPL